MGPTRPGGAAPGGRHRAAPYRLIASDLDGTLLDRSGMLTARTAAALEAVRTRGVDVVAVTGRPPRWVTDLGLGPGLAVCSNGALVVDLATGAIVAERTLDPGSGAEIVARLRATFPGAILAVEHAGGVGLERAWAEQVTRRRVERVAPAEELVREPAAKILARVPGLVGDALVDRAATAVGPLGVVTASGSQVLVEVSAPGVDKATALAALAGERALAAAHVVAFGDARNDVPMLAWAGRGVAMADAHPAAREVADEITDATCEDDGVAAWIERHLL